MKTCTRCHLERPLEEYGRQPGGKAGLKAQCHTCLNEYRRNRYKVDARYRETTKQRAKQYCQNNKEAVLARAKVYTSRTKARRQEYNLQRLYGITVEQKQQMQIAQDNKCSICRQERKLVVEHDHATGAIRSLACSSCNTALGLLKENELTAVALVDYIRTHCANKNTNSSS